MSDMNCRTRRVDRIVTRAISYAVCAFTVLSSLRYKYKSDLLAEPACGLTNLGTSSGFVRWIRAGDPRHAAPFRPHGATSAMTRGEFAASIAHETREPISAIVTDGDVCLRWLNRDVPDLQEARTCVRRMIANAMRTDNVVARLRALANSDVSGHTLLDLNGIVGDVLPLVEHELAACDITLDVALAPGGLRVNGDQEQLQQVLLNLVVNAIQAMEQTADRPRVLSIRSDLGAIDGAAPCAMIKASDTGPGIEAGAMSRLFAPFYTTKPQGMGMGLSACRSIVQAHGGIIDAVRGRASGAAFTMAIPIYVRAKVPARRRQSITLWQRTKVTTA